MGAFAGVAILVVLAARWQAFSVLQRLSVANLAVLFLHYFEEFGVPGGFGKLANTFIYENSPAVDRWPCNQNSMMIAALGSALAWYVPPIVFPRVIWLGLMPALFGVVVQGAGHIIVTPQRLKRAGLRYPYNSGLLTNVLGQLPIGLAYCYVVQASGLATAWDWVIGLAYAVFAYAVFRRLLLMKPLADLNSPWPFDATELKRFDRLYGA